MIKIFDELEYALNLLKNGFSSHYGIDIMILVKYYKYIGYRNNEVKKEVISFCKKFDPNFNLFLFESKIDNIIKKTNGNLRIPIDIPVTEKEVEKIKELKNFRYEKILFTMLVFAKYNKLTNNSPKGNLTEKYFYNGKLSHLFRIAHSSQKKNENIGYVFYQNGYISDIRKKDTFIINFTDMADNSPVKILVNDIKNTYKFWKSYCVECGEYMEKRSNSHILCKKCYKNRKKEQNKLWIREYRKK